MSDCIDCKYYEVDKYTHNICRFSSEFKTCRDNCPYYKRDWGFIIFLFIFSIVVIAIIVIPVLMILSFFGVI